MWNGREAYAKREAETEVVREGFILLPSRRLKSLNQPKSQTQEAIVGVSDHWQKDVVNQEGPSYLWLPKPDKAFWKR